MLLEPNARSRRPAWGRGLLAFVLALLGHGVFIALLVFISLFKLHVPPSDRPKVARPVTIRGLSDQQWAQNRGAVLPESKDERLSQKPREEKPKPPPKPEERPKGQVVDVAPGNQQKPAESDYLAESNNTVKKQTRAKHQTSDYRNAMPRETSTVPHEGEGAQPNEQVKIAGNNGRADDDRPLREPDNQKSLLELPDIQKRSEVAMKESDPNGPGYDISNRTESETVAGNSNRMRVQKGAAGGTEEASLGKRGEAGLNQALLPSSAVLDKITGAAPNDHLKDVDDGEGTFLNTKEWKYASFFNRVKQSVSHHWNPSQQLQLRDPTLNIYGGRDRYTVVNVTLNDRGQLKEVYVEKSCGVDFLDLEAVKSFERAQPFPNPPPGLATADGNVRFQFGFFLEMTGGGRLRLFRSAD